MNRFSVANALMQSATHLELNHRDEVHKHIASVLYKEAQALVEAIGPAVHEVKVGDYVLFNAYSGMIVNDADEGNKLIMLTEKAVIALVTPPTTKVPNVSILTDQGPVDATSESLILLLRESFQRVPRVAELKNKWEGRLGA